MVSLTQQRLLAAEELARSGSTRKAAKAAGVAESTIRNWKREKEFQDLINLFCAIFYQATVSRVVSAVSLLMDKLYGEIEKTKEPEILLQIAQALTPYFELIQAEAEKYKGKTIGFTPPESKSLAEMVAEAEKSKEK